MTVSQDPRASTVRRLVERIRPAEDADDVSAFATTALGLIAAVLVAVSTLTAIEIGYTAIALSFLAAVGIFLGTLFVFEAGHRLGTNTED